MSELRRYILLPAEGFTSNALRAISERRDRRKGQGGLSAEARKTIPSVPGVDEIEVVDSVAADGPKVVAVPPETAQSLRKTRDPFILAPIRKYRSAVRPFATVRTKGLFSGADQRASIKVLVQDSQSNMPLAGVSIAAVLDTVTMVGLRRVTGRSGQATLTFPGSVKPIARLYVYPPNGYWGKFSENVTLKNGDVIHLERVDLATPDLLQHLYQKRARSLGKGVRVGVIDSGVDKGHSDLRVSGGANVTDDGSGEREYGPVTDHGTHVAGIIAGRGERSKGMTGIAPEAEIYSYRVFEQGRPTTDTTFIMKAIYRAVKDGCHLINMSLGGGTADPTLNRAMGYAFENGVVCVAAAGNNHRKDVSYPAWYKRAVAVSAIGKTGTFPSGSLDSSEIREPFSSADKTIFVAAFSNIGYEVDFTGPGVAIVSTVPNNGYAVLSGTSMACPAVTGVLAGLLSANSAILRMKPDTKRSLAILELARNAAVTQGFNQRFEGLGLPQL